MRKSAFLHIIKIVIVSVIPACLSYLANSELIFDKLIEMNIVSSSIQVSLIQDYCLWIGIVVSAIFLSGQLIIVKIQYDRVSTERNLLIKMSKNIFAGTLGKACFSNHPEFDVRIFIPKHPIVYKFADLFHVTKITKKFVIKNIDLIAEQGLTKNLEFEVSPNQEGLVGLCYETKTMVYDDDLEHSNSVGYNLGQNQISRTSNLKWSVCCPIFGENDTVVAIIALDGKSKITIKKNNEPVLNEHIVAFSRLLYDSVPQLFKR